MKTNRKPWEVQADRGVELLQLCSDLQSEKDGVNRPKINQIDMSKTIDQFAMDIQVAATNMKALYKLFPLMHDLSALGKKLQADGKISADWGDDYPRLALDYFLSEHGLEVTKHI